ncbi:hypothetical protein CHUAL_005902 [Chamberlinius hualienensis]
MQKLLAYTFVVCSLLLVSNVVGFSFEKQCPGTKQFETIRDDCIEEHNRLHPSIPIDESVYCTMVLDLTKNMDMSNDEMNEICARYEDCLMCTVTRLDLIDLSTAEINEEALAKIGTTIMGWASNPEVVTSLTEVCTEFSKPGIDFEDPSLPSRLFARLLKAFDKGCHCNMFGDNCNA